MAIIKKTDDFKSFEFQELSFEKPNSMSGAYEFAALKQTTTGQSSEVLEEENKTARKQNFKINSHVKDWRGLTALEESQTQEKINSALQDKYDEIQQAAYEEGLKRGLEEGKAEGKSQAEDEQKKFGEALQAIIENLSKEKEGLLLNHQKDIYAIVKNLVRWLSLKEVSEEKSEYLERLITQLILQLNTRTNLIIKVSATNYQYMEEAMRGVEKKLGVLGSYRYEISPEIEDDGLIVESENGIIDASIQAQMETLDNLFKEL